MTESQMHFQRYAVYFTPPVGPLAEFGASWLGWDITSGTKTAHPDLPEISSDIAKFTETPRKYGFHATIKPPFFLSEQQDYTNLQSAFKNLCALLSPVTLDGLQLSQLGRFLALTATGNTNTLNALSAQTVRDLDMFRATPSAADLDKRRSPNLSARQNLNVTNWGYAHVMEDFRFHMTLTGNLPKAQATNLLESLTPYVIPLVPTPFTIDHLTLVGQDLDGNFHQIERRALTGKTASR